VQNATKSSGFFFLDFAPLADIMRPFHEIRPATRAGKPPAAEQHGRRRQSQARHTLVREARKGKYMTETDAVKAGYRPAKKE